MQKLLNEFLIASQIREINSKINHDLRERFKNSGFTIPQITFIRILNKHHIMKINEISKKMSLANSTVSGIADRLEKQNIIRRIRNKEDKRIVNVELTDKGKEIIKGFRDTINDYFENVFKNCDEKEMNLALEGLEIIKKALEI